MTEASVYFCMDFSRIWILQSGPTAYIIRPETRHGRCRHYLEYESICFLACLLAATNPRVSERVCVCVPGLTENAAHEIDGHKIGRRDIAYTFKRLAKKKLINCHILCKYFESVFLQLQLVKILYM